jgi:hypothetical protein
LASGLRHLIERALGPSAPAAPAAPAAPFIHSLDKGATKWIARPYGRAVTCQSGALWLTFDNQPVDVVLEAGQSHRCTSASRLGIHALAAASLSVR